MEFASHMETEREMERDRERDEVKAGEKEKGEHGMASQLALNANLTQPRVI